MKIGLASRVDYPVIVTINKKTKESIILSPKQRTKKEFDRDQIGDFSAYEVATIR